MSEAAQRQRSKRQAWAAPRGRHDRLIQILQVALPAAIGVLAAVLAIAPLQPNAELNFLLRRDNVEMAPEWMRVQAARYMGTDDEGNRFQLRAGSAIQRSSTDSVIQLGDLAAEMTLPSGRAVIVANRGRYDMDSERVALDGPLTFRSEDGYAMDTSDVLLDLNSRVMASRGAVEGRIPLGTFSAGSMRVDMGERTVELEGRARLHIVQGLGR